MTVGHWRFAIVATAALALGSASAAPPPAPGPVLPAACQRALDAMDAAQAAVAGAPAARTASAANKGTSREADPRLLSLRREAAVACLGAGAASAPVAQTRAQAPVAVPRLPSRPPGAWPVPPSLAGPAPAPPAAAPPRAAGAPTVTSCDAAGCWASDGTRLNKSGPGLLGPRGFCTQQGSFLQCP